MESIRRRALTVSVALLGALLCPNAAHAEPPSGKGEHRIEWTYRHFQPWEYSMVIGVSVTAAYVEATRTSFAPHSEWRGVLFDDGARSSLVAKSSEGRARAATISNYLWHATQWYPVVVDSLLFPLVFDKGNTETAAQMVLIDWQAQSTAFFLLRIGAHVVGRQRPALTGCESDSGYDATCDPKSTNRYVSFPAGHPTMAFSGAGLVCAHHLALPVYGSDAAGWAACGVALGSATVTGLLRIVADKHWTTDVMIGSLIGFGSGFGLPYFLHYGPHLRANVAGEKLDFAVMPTAGDALAGISFVALQ